VTLGRPARRSTAFTVLGVGVAALAAVGVLALGDDDDTTTSAASTSSAPPAMSAGRGSGVASSAPASASATPTGSTAATARAAVADGRIELPDGIEPEAATTFVTAYLGLIPRADVAEANQALSDGSAMCRELDSVSVLEERSVAVRWLLDAVDAGYEGSDTWVWATATGDQLCPRYDDDVTQALAATHLGPPATAARAA
jgi:hypothetical protein